MESMSISTWRSLAYTTHLSASLQTIQKAYTLFYTRTALFAGNLSLSVFLLVKGQERSSDLCYLLPQFLWL